LRGFTKLKKKLSISLGRQKSAKTPLAGAKMIRALFIWPAKDGGATFVGCRKVSPPCSFYCTEDARSNYENLQKLLKTRLFWAYFVPIISKHVWLYLT
jgi:hypothetical protein